MSNPNQKYYLTEAERIEFYRLRDMAGDLHAAMDRWMQNHLSSAFDRIDADRTEDDLG